jgi:hypothetical protein
MSLATLLQGERNVMTASLFESGSVVRVSTPVVAGQQQYGDTVFPFAVRCESAESDRAAVEAWISSGKDELLRLASKHGAVLFRGCPLSSAEDFDAFVAALGVANFPYRKSLSNAVRVVRTDRVFSANEAPPEVSIYFHHEMAQTPIFPATILFFCEIAAAEGGATPICRSDVLYDRLQAQCPAFIEKCEAKGLRYSNVMPSDDDPKSGMGRSWKSTLEVTNREAAEERLRKLGYTWEWLPDGCLRATTPPLPAVMELGEGRKSFFNQLIAAFCGWKDERNDPSKAIRHGDGSPLDTDAVMRAVALAEELAFDLAWRPGDAVLIDNTVTMHARRTFKGARKVWASLADMLTQEFTVR